MGIQKEREAFERHKFKDQYDELKAYYDEHERKHGYRYPPYTYDDEWEAWLAAKAQARQARVISEPVLDAPACVGGGTFQPGVKWSTVIRAAQRHYEKDGHHERPVVSVQDQLRIASGHSVIVPIKVTDKMIESTDALPDGCTVDEIYEAMIKAAQEQNA